MNKSIIFVCGFVFKKISLNYNTKINNDDNNGLALFSEIFIIIINQLAASNGK